MPKATPDYNLLIAKPNLVKEWHPTKNIGVRPGDLTPGSSKKVWWICSAGHEWKAVIYSRSRGSGCPLCSKGTKKDSGYLALTNPDLIREWHPTKNGALNPRNVTSGHLKKVWWVCVNGHEWEDTIKSRIKGNGCPVCESDFVWKSLKPIEKIGNRLEPIQGSSVISGSATVFFEQDLSETYDGIEFRNGTRYPLKATAILEIKASGYWIYAQMNNFSNDGMYFETEVALKPGTKIIIKFDKPIFPNASKRLTSIVRWCKGLADDRGTISSFGLGVKFIQPESFTR
jgi:hypothetical protein